MARNYRKEAALKLRHRGLSYNEIRKTVPVSKSTLSIWLKGVLLRAEDRERLYKKRLLVLLRGPRCQKERRAKEVEAIIGAAQAEIRVPVSKDANRLFGAALYWAEGNKTKNMGITNSDPFLIAYMVRWLQRQFGIPPTDLKAWLNIYAQQNETELKNFWSDLTGIPVANFGKTFIKPSGKGFKKNDLYYGTIRVHVSRGTDKRHRIYGWIQAVLQPIEKEVEFVQRKWESIKDTKRPANL
ncbi:MAG: hypothetical protein HY978_03910 [Candidatus Liptonbacteria bacterium]|nr:hypothetical protein [Candidatus Liptonbacteria bacterium]